MQNPTNFCAIKLQPTLDQGGGTFSLSDPAGKIGWIGEQFYLLNGDQFLVVEDGWMARKVRGGMALEVMIAPQVKARLTIVRSPRGWGWMVTPGLINRGKKPFVFTGYGFRIADGQQGHQLGRDPRHHVVYAHAENLRYEVLPHCRVMYPFLRPLPTTEVGLGAQPCGGIPALVVGQVNGNTWLLEGALTQERHRLTWHIGLPSGNGRILDGRSQFFWTGGHAETVLPGATVTLETIIFLAVQASPDQFYKPYMAELQAQHRFMGPTSRLAREPVYCTWNYGIYTGVTEADCRRRMDIVAEIQKGGFFQIDHGYQPPSKPGEQPSPEVDVYFPTPDRAWDPTRFPSGAHGFVEACRRRGLRPTIWFSPRVQIDGAIAKAHPDWLLLDREGKPIREVGYLMLDYSVPAVRDFLDQCVRTITKDWGFEGIKLDFCSWMFDYPALVYRYGGTGTDRKRELLRMIRGYLGPNGYFLHCVSCPLGDPFLAVEACDSYRAGIDIDIGHWEHHVHGAGWLLPGMLANDRNIWFGNIDSCMGKPDIPVVERRSRLAFAYMTAGMLEFSGPVEKLDHAARDDYRRMVRRLDAGTGFECPDEAAFYGPCYPRVLLRRHAVDSYTRREFGVIATIGLFNWTDVTQVTAYRLTDWRLGKGRSVLRDFWNGKMVSIRNGVVAAVLPPRGHALLDVKTSKACNTSTDTTSRGRHRE